jgi:hypothetical protein
MSNNNWKRIGGFSRTGTQNYVRTNDAAMGGTTFGSTDVSNNTGNLTQRIGNNAGVIFINGDIDMDGGPTVAAPINRIKNVRDPSNNQDVATKYYVDRIVTSILNLNQNIGPTGPEGPPGIGYSGNNGSDGSTGPTGVTGAAGPPGDVVGVLGPTGQNGARGATGANGVAGATGPIGVVGPQGAKGDQGAQGIQGSNGTILWLNPDGDSKTNELIIDSYLLSPFPIQSTMRTIGPISVSATYGNDNKMIPASRFWNNATKISSLAVIPSGVWVVNLYAAVPSNSDANQVSIYAAVFMITGTVSQPLPSDLIIETKEGGNAGYYPPRAAYLPDHVKYVGRSWEISSTPANAGNVLTSNTTGIIVTSTAKNLYKIQMPVDFVTLKDAGGNADNVYLQLQIYVKNTKQANQNANVLLYYQTNPTTTETTYSYLQTTFGAVGTPGPAGTPGSVGPTGSTGNNGLAGPTGFTGSVGPIGPTGSRGPTGPQGATGPTGPAGQSNSFGVQNSVQYRSNPAPLGENDPNGSFGGSANFRFVPGPVGFTANASDASMGTVVINDLACNSIHSSFYVEDPSITGTNTRPRTFVRGGGYKLGDNSNNYIVLASGKNTTDGGATQSPATPADITHGIKLFHNIDGNPATATINLHDNSKTGKVAMNFDLTTGNITAADNKFCLLNSSGRVGVGGITPTELTAAGASGLNRALHVSGNVMVGTHPVGTPSLVASSAMIMLNQATSTPTTKDYPGLYHRSVLSTTASTLGLQDSTGGLGITAPNFITFQTGVGATQSNSIVINSAGDVSVIGRTNLNGRVGVGLNFNDTTTRNGVQSILDISGVTHMSSTANTYGVDNPRIKVISNVISRTADIPNFTHSVNEIRGMNTTENSGFLRLTAQTSGNSCIDLIGVNEHPTGIKYNNSVRIATGGAERMIIDGSGNVGVGTNTLVTGVRLDVAGGQARVTAASTTSTALTTTGRIGINIAAPTATLDVAGDVKVSSTLTTGGMDVTGNTILRNSVRIGSSSAPTATLDVTGDVKVSSTLTTTGNVGIMTASPTAPLDVTGNTILRNSVRIGSSSAPTTTLDVAGAAKITGNLDMNSTGRIVNLVNPSSAQDAATRNYVDTALSSGVLTNNPTVADAANANATYRVLFTTATSGRATLNNDAQLFYNPSSDTLTATTFSGSLSGNATSAGTATTAEYASRTPSNKFTINGGSGYSNNIPADTMLYIKDQGWGYGPKIRLTSSAGEHFTIGSDSGGPNCYIINENNGSTRFATNNLERMRISAAGYVGIGTTAPTTPLHVENALSASIATGNRLLDGGGLNTIGSLDRLSVAGFYGGYVVTNYGYTFFSDQRIKTNIINVDIQSNLELFRKIRPVKHGYIDKLEYGNVHKYGFIAQEVQPILPEAVIKGTQIIPSIYKTATVVNNVLLHFDKPIQDIKQFSIGIKLKCYDDKNEIVWVVIKAIIDTQNIEIEEKITNDRLFVYGHSVDDFLQLDHDTIYTVATAALQEVDRQQQADKARIAELEATVAAQQSLINDILERLKKVGA